MVDLRKLKTLIDLVQQSGISELEITEGEERVRISRGVPTYALQAGAPAQAVTPAPAAVAPPAGAEAEPEGHVIRSPMVGTFYRASAPGAKPFVEVGQEVKSGQTLCIIEAMKLLNEIESEAAGEIVKIHPENGQPVQYGDPLFSLRPAR